MFEEAVRTKMRFHSSQGLLTVEDLWDLPLISPRSNVASLDQVAKNVNQELKLQSEESFVATVSPQTSKLEKKLELVKHVIAVKLREREEQTMLAQRQQEKRELLSLLESKNKEELQELSKEQIEERLKALS